MTKSSFLRSAGIGAALAAGGMYLFDPDRGRSRRARLADQTGAVMRKAGEKMRAQARYQKGVARGVAHKVGEPFRPEVEIDDETLLQKIRSEAVGRWRGPKQAIEIDVRDGRVTLRGETARAQAEELIHLLEAVDGVETVIDQMKVTQQA